MRLTKEDRDSIADDLASLTCLETQGVIDGSTFTERHLARLPDKAEWAKHIKRCAEARLDYMAYGLGSERRYLDVKGYIKQLDEFIAANTPEEVG